MSSPSVLDLFLDSPIRQAIEPATSRMIEELIELLEEAPEDGDVDALRRRVKRNRSFIVDRGLKGFKRILESYGFFRRDPKTGFRLALAVDLDRWLDETPIAVIDLEATGGRPPIHRYIELALVRRTADGTRSTFSSLAYPDRPLPRYVTKVTGIREEDLRDAPTPVHVFREAVPFLKQAILVFHGSGPDMEYLNYEAFRATNSLLQQPIVCTTALARFFEPDLQTMGLDKVLGHLGRKVTVQHRALDDAEMTLGLYEIFEARFAKAGIEKVTDLAFFQGIINDPPYISSNLSTEKLNDLPAGKGAYALWDAQERLIHADFSNNLRHELQGYFFADGALPHKVRKWVRQAAYLDFLPWDGKANPVALIRKVTHPGRD